MSSIERELKLPFEKSFYKDNFEISITVEDESIFKDIQEFISFEVEPQTNITYDVVRIVFMDKTDLDPNVKSLTQNGRCITIHGGTPSQQVFGKKVITQDSTIYSIPLNDEYIIQNKDKDYYILYGDNKGKEENLYRIVREIYYRKSLALGRVAMHSAAVADPEGNCILLSGKKASGKTTLLCNLLASNLFSLIDNDRILIGVSNQGFIQVHSMSSTINIGYGTMRLCPERFNCNDYSSNSDSSKKKKYSRKAFIAQFGCSAINSAIAKSIVFPTIKEGATARLIKNDANKTLTKVLTSIEAFDNNEHPDWLEISNVSEEQYERNVRIIIKKIAESLLGYDLEFGYDKISDSIIKQIEVEGK